MALIVRELHPSAGDTQVVKDGTAASRTFAVFDDATASNVAAAHQVIATFGNGTMPNYGEFFSPSITTLVALDYELRPAPSSRNVWLVTWNYAPTSGGVNPGTPGYWEFQYRSGLEWTPAYRVSPSANSSEPALLVPTAGDPTFVGGDLPEDVLGESIDSAGEPADAKRLVQMLEIVEHIQGPFFPGSTLGFVGKRNSTAFLGANAGRLVYMGITASGRIDRNLFSVTHTMAWDEWYHMRQRPVRLSNGDVMLRRRSPTLINSGSVAHYVYWFQPFPTKANFNDISPNWP